MSDDVDVLHRANPVSVGSVRRHITADRRVFIEAMEADRASGGPVGPRSGASGPVVRWALAAAAAVAMLAPLAVLLAGRGEIDPLLRDSVVPASPPAADEPLVADEADPPAPDGSFTLIPAPPPSVSADAPIAAERDADNGPADDSPPTTAEADAATSDESAGPAGGGGLAPIDAPAVVPADDADGGGDAAGATPESPPSGGTDDVPTAPVDQAPPPGTVPQPDDGAGTPPAPVDPAPPITQAPAPTSSAPTDEQGGGGDEPTPSPTSTNPDPDDGEPTSAPPIASAFDRTTDLLVVHFDFAHLDEAHATVATLELATWFDLDPFVVAGTADPETRGANHDYVQVMTAAWGDGWLDAGVGRESAVEVAAGRWLDAIEDGGHVWVGEGGVSDFTAEVMREVRRQRPDLDTSTFVHVVHHSSRNENATRAGDLDYLRDTSSYERIDDGNSSNDTADLNGRSELLVDAARAGEHSGPWVAAFEAFAPERLDFSDTVTVLHVLGVGVDRVADADDFARVVLGAG